MLKTWRLPRVVTCLLPFGSLSDSASNPSALSLQPGRVPVSIPKGAAISDQHRAGGRALDSPGKEEQMALLPQGFGMAAARQGPAGVIVTAGCWEVGGRHPRAWRSVPESCYLQLSESLPFGPTFLFTHDMSPFGAPMCDRQFQCLGSTQARGDSIGSGCPPKGCG